MSRTGLMMAMMEPPATLEEEFQDWYDNEHFPERANCEGFLTAKRLTCLQGFPCYLALYDLADITVMDGPAYGAIARNRYSLWTKRIIPRVWGHYRFEGEQIFPGTALLGTAGYPSRVLLWRFGAVPDGEVQAIVDGVQASCAGLDGVLQARVFHGRAQGDPDMVATIELAGNVPVPTPRATAFGPALRRLKVANLYTPYWR
jgi:hypothetical protein